MFSFVGDTVLDPFCGSGTTILAAMNTERNSIGVETEAFYCDYSIRRIENSRTIFNDFAFQYIDLIRKEDCYKSQN